MNARQLVRSGFRFSCMLLLVTFPPAMAAQNSTGSRKTPNTLGLGQRIFEQRCPICHTPPIITSKVYGPSLSREMVEGNEDYVRKIILEGTDHMPGFRYALQSSEIDAVIEYLKTLSPSTRPGVAGAHK